MPEQNGDLRSLMIATARLETKVERMSADLKELQDKIDNNVVSKKEFDPIQRIVYGIVGLILVGVVTAVLALVVGV